MVHSHKTYLLVWRKDSEILRVFAKLSYLCCHNYILIHSHILFHDIK